METSLAHRSPEYRFADRAEGLGEDGPIMPGRHITGFEMDIGDSLVVAAEEAPQDLRQVPPLAAAKAADDAEVDGH